MDASTVNLVRGKLDAASGGRWTFHYIELQDDNELLMASLELSENFNIRELAAIRKEIHDILSPVIPSRPSNYSFVVALNFEGHMVNALMGGCAGSPPRI